LEGDRTIALVLAENAGEPYKAGGLRKGVILAAYIEKLVFGTVKKKRTEKGIDEEGIGGPISDFSSVETPT